MAWLVMELQQLIGAKRQRRVGPPLAIAELDFKHTGCEPLDDSANLATPNRLIGGIVQQRNYGKQLEFPHGIPQPK
jgi:hypothetical protein